MSVEDGSLVLKRTYVSVHVNSSMRATNNDGTLNRSAEDQRYTDGRSSTRAGIQHGQQASERRTIRAVLEGGKGFVATG